MYVQDNLRWVLISRLFLFKIISFVKPKIYQAYLERCDQEFPPILPEISIIIIPK